MTSHLARLSPQVRILLGLAVGLVLGLAAGPRATVLAPIGTIFVRLLTLVAIPLVFCALTASMKDWSNVRAIGKTGGTLLAYIVGMTSVSLVLGLGAGIFFEPGKGVTLTTEDRQLPQLPSAPAQSLSGLLLDLVPANLFRAAAEGNLLQIIFAAILLGWAMVQISAESRAVLYGVLAAANEALFRLIHIILGFAPIGVAALIAAAIGQQGPGVIGRLSYYILAIVLAFAIHLVLIQGAWIKRFSSIGPFDYLRRVRPVHSMAFATTSSVATLPVSIECSEHDLKLPPAAVRFVLPIAANLSREGGGIFQALSSVFVAQMFGIPLTFGILARVFIAGFFASVSTAAIPSGSMVNLTITLSSAGLPLEGLGLVWAVDRIVDLFRTVVNVNGQIAALTLISRFWTKLSR